MTKNFNQLKIGNLLKLMFSGNRSKKWPLKIEQPNLQIDFLCISLITHSKASFYLKLITTIDVIKHIKQFNSAKSTGPEEISLKYITRSPQIIAQRWKISTII